MSLDIVTYCERCGGKLEAREVGGCAMIKQCKCCAPRPADDAPTKVVEMVEVSDAREGRLWGSARGYWYGLPVPTEPGWYWARIKGEPPEATFGAIGSIGDLPHVEWVQPRPTLDAPVPTEPGYYWARMTQTGCVMPVSVLFGLWGVTGASEDRRSGKVQVFGHAGLLLLDHFDRWSARIPEPEVE